MDPMVLEAQMQHLLYNQADRRDLSSLVNSMPLPRHQAELWLNAGAGIKDPARKVCVQVVGLAGDKLELNLHARDQISHIKAVIEVDWQIPCSCQSLIHGSQVFHDDDMSIGSLCSPDETTLVFSVVIALDDVLNDLQSNVFYKQVQALADLGKLGHKAAGSVTETVVEHLRSPLGCSCEAVQALGQIAEKGNELALGAIWPLLTDTTPAIKEAAIVSFGKIAIACDEDTLRLFCQALGDQSIGVRKASKCTLIQFVGKGNLLVVDLICELLESEDAIIASSAVDALIQLTERGDTYCIAAVQRLLSHESVRVVQSALKAFGNVVERGDASAMDLVRSYLTNANPCLRQAAVDALGDITEKDDERGIAELLGCLENEYFSDVKRAALRVLPRITTKSKVDIVAICGCCEDDDQVVRRLAVDTIRELAERGDQDAIDAVKSCLSDAHQNVRQAAVEALGKIGLKEDAQLVTKVSSKLENKNNEFKAVAKAALNQLNQL